MASCDLQLHLQFIVRMLKGQFFTSPPFATLTGFDAVVGLFCQTRTVRFAYPLSDDQNGSQAIDNNSLRHRKAKCWHL